MPAPEAPPASLKSSHSPSGDTDVGVCTTSAFVVSGSSAPVPSAGLMYRLRSPLRVAR
jgi:hypothetical protein